VCPPVCAGGGIHPTTVDAIRAGIPTGYSIKNWDPTEPLVVLLGSVFDPNSLGKWIYDRTVIFAEDGQDILYIEDPIGRKWPTSQAEVLC
jgi:hypothetical protein